MQNLKIYKGKIFLLLFLISNTVSFARHQKIKIYPNESKKIIVTNQLIDEVMYIGPNPVIMYANNSYLGVLSNSKIIIKDVFSINDTIEISSLTKNSIQIGQPLKMKPITDIGLKVKVKQKNTRFYVSILLLVGILSTILGIKMTSKNLFKNFWLNFNIFNIDYTQKFTFPQNFFFYCLYVYFMDNFCFYFLSSTQS